MARFLALVLLTLLAARSPAAALQASPEEQLAAASALYDQKKFLQAAAVLEGFLKAHPQHARRGPAALALARCYVEQKQYARAIPAYEKAVASRDAATLALARLGMGEAALLDRQFARAARVLEECVRESHPPERLALAYYWLGQARSELGRYLPAVEAYRKVIDDHLGAEFADGAYLGAGFAAYRGKDPAGARSLLSTLLARFPESEERVHARILLAQVDLDERKYAEARRGFELAMSDPGFTSASVGIQWSAEEGLVRALLETEQFEAATARLRGVLGRLTKGDVRLFAAQLSLGHCLFRQKQHEPALSAYREAAKGTQGAVAAEGHYWAANVLLALDRPAEAAAEFARVVQRFPTHDLAPRAQRRAGDALAAARNPGAAAEAYRTVVQKYPRSPEAVEARKLLASTYESFSDPTQIQAALKSAAPAQRPRLSLRLARVYADRRQFDRAEAVLRPLLTLPSTPDRAEAHYLLGLALEGLRKPAPAAAAFEAALRLAPGDWKADARSRLAWLHLDLKQPDKAEAHARKSLAENPGEEGLLQARLVLLQALLDQQKWAPAREVCRKLSEGEQSPETTESVAYAEAWIASRIGSPDEARKAWERLAGEFAQGRHAAEAHVRLGEIHFKAEEYAAARGEFEAALRAGSTGPLARDARFKLGSTLYNLEQFELAAAEWGRVAQDAGAGTLIPEALYWQGLALEKAGMKPQAVRALEQLVQRFPKHARVGAARVRLAVLKAG